MKQLIIQLISCVDSTNRFLSEMQSVQKLPDGYCLSADYQTKGRGQAGNIWESNKNENLLISILLYTDKFPLNQQFLLSKIISVAICDFMQKKSISVKIKYPNDIFYNDRKIAGILIENKIVGNKMDYSIVGIGINVNQKDFSDDLPMAISMKNITGITYRRIDILEDIVGLITDYVSYFGIKNSLETYQALYLSNLYRGKGFFRYKAEDEMFEAKIINVEDNGRITLMTKENILKHFYFKELRFVF